MYFVQEIRKGQWTDILEYQSIYRTEQVAVHLKRLYGNRFRMVARAKGNRHDPSQV